MHPKLTQDCESTTINNTKNPQTLAGLLPPPPAPPRSLRTAAPEPLEAQSTATLKAALLSSRGSHGGSRLQRSHLSQSSPLPRSWCLRTAWSGKLWVKIQLETQHRSPRPPPNLPGHVSFPDKFHVYWLLSWLSPRLGTLGQPQLIYSLPSNRQTQAMN